MLAGTTGSPVKLTHPERVLWDEPRITKHDLARWYADLAPQLLREIGGRPVSLVRCPDGTAGACFFQRHLGPGFPGVVTEQAVPGARDGMKSVIVIDDADGLQALAQMSVLEIHAWGTRLAHIEQPDRIVLDLDPGAGVAWKRVVAAARLLRGQLRALGLDSFVRTSGGKGLHVVVPLRPQAGWDAVKGFAEAVARSCAAEFPREFTAVSGERNRKGLIFVDYLRNGRSASAVASYSLRNRVGAPAATPLSWTELGRLESAADFGYANLRARLKRLRRDPWEGSDALDQVLPARN